MERRSHLQSTPLSTQRKKSTPSPVNLRTRSPSWWAIPEVGIGECNCAYDRGDEILPCAKLTISRNDTQKTIEGDLFGAFVRAGAISKSNADDPKKSSLVRCARTDKGVHAAGNIVSLKLITEDTDIVQKINRELCPQIRVFGISRVNGGFSAYQLCDSRIYEYLIPTYCFLPPHPDSFLARKLLELAGEAGDLEGYQLRQEEVSNFWSQVEKDHINPILERADPNFLPVIRKALYQIPDKPEAEERVATTTNALLEQEVLDSSESQHILPKIPETAEPVIKELKSAYLLAKKAYRISQARRSRILATLNSFIGTHNFHNYTVNKTPRDPSASRVIKSMTLDDDSKIIEGTEWLSIKIHGQSFMMHQIRKMISTVAMIVRCGAEPQRVISLTFSRERVSIPKAPGLGLLLERPVFDAYNEKKLVGEFGREPVGFTKYEVEMQEFKQNEIYDRIWREEAEGAIFHGYFSSVDNLHSSQLLYLSSMGVDALSRAENSEKQARSVDDAVAEATGLDDGSEGMPDEPDG